MTRDFSGKSVLVTGGASGLGLAVARRFVDAGAAVTIFDRSGDTLERAAADLGAGIITIHGDATSYEDNVRAVDAAVATFGGLDVFVANAGIFDGHVSLENIPAEQLAAACDEILGVDVKGYILGAKAALPHLRSRGGSLIFTASVSSFHPAFGGTLYITAKHAVMGLTKRLALELAPDVRVNAVGPGYIATNLGGVSVLGQPVANVSAPPPADRFPHGRLPRPEDYAGLYTFLASDDARTITGVTLLADSGASIRPPA
jgi:NAD(P)-dependent dehydrogenase (short-subunit alcohol dehydrogenase family)